jgi:hypothetical protein
VRESEMLATTLSVVLWSGNVLNAGTSRGGANGFKLRGLLQLGDVRCTTAVADRAATASDGTASDTAATTAADRLAAATTLLEYVVRTRGTLAREAHPLARHAARWALEAA